MSRILSMYCESFSVSANAPYIVLNASPPLGELRRVYVYQREAGTPISGDLGNGVARVNVDIDTFSTLYGCAGDPIDVQVTVDGNRVTNFDFAYHGARAVG